MKDITKDVKFFTDCAFPNYVFVKKGTEIICAKKMKPTTHNQRHIDHFWLTDKNGKYRAISEGRICAAMELQRDVNDVTYVPQNRSFRVKSNAALLGLIKAKQSLVEELQA